MVSLREMDERRQSWINSKPQWDGGFELRLNKDDIVIGWFVANGDEGDRFIKVYKAHILAGKSKNGKDISIPSYCPLKTEDPELTECANCSLEHDDIKERMSMYFYVKAILHTTMPPEKQFPLTEYQGKRYFLEEVNGFKVWHTSAWKESPWTDIVKLSEMYKGLHNFTFQLDVNGEGINRRFKLYALPQSEAFDPTLYEKAKVDLEPLRNVIVREMTTPLQQGPAATAATITSNAPAFKIGEAAPPQQQVQPFAAPGTTISPFTPGIIPAGDNTAPDPNLSPNSSETDERRPLKKLF